LAQRKATSGTQQLRRIIGLALVSLLICGLFFPLVTTAVAQLLFPYQANGEIASVNGQPVGSFIAVNATDYSSPLFFHLRSDSASGFDPDITLQDAQSQIPRVSNGTGIPVSTLQGIVNQNAEGVWWVFGAPYINVEKVNLFLVSQYPSVYANFTKTVAQR